jgi:hypothetical protein
VHYRVPTGPAGVKEIPFRTVPPTLTGCHLILLFGFDGALGKPLFAALTKQNRQDQRGEAQGDKDDQRRLPPRRPPSGRARRTSRDWP